MQGILIYIKNDMNVKKKKSIILKPHLLIKSVTISEKLNIYKNSFFGFPWGMNISNMHFTKVTTQMYNNIVYLLFSLCH